MSSDGAVEVTWYGQAMFTISGGGVTVAIDPVPPEVGYRYHPVDADVVLVTHGHFDHGYLEGVRGDPQVVSTGGPVSAGGLDVVGYPAFHDESEGAQRGPMVLFSWEQAGLKLAHLGDLGDRPADDVMESLAGLDVVMIPVGGVFTIDGKEAALLSAELAPAVVLPMHYGTPDCVIELHPVDDFTRSFAGEVRRVPDRPVVISCGSLPAETEAWVLRYR